MDPFDYVIVGGGSAGSALATGSHMECQFADPIGPFTAVEAAFLVPM